MTGGLLVDAGRSNAPPPPFFEPSSPESSPLAGEIVRLAGQVRRDSSQPPRLASQRENSRPASGEDLEAGHVAPHLRGGVLPGSWPASLKTLARQAGRIFVWDTGAEILAACRGY
jgi:hypothetical protein